MGTKIPVSVLVVIHTQDLHVLLIERADHPGFWQSVTGSVDRADEPLVHTCRREVLEETGIDAARYELSDWGLRNEYEIYPHWRHRYPEGVTRNTEHVFGLRLPEPVPVCLMPREHSASVWLPWADAANRCFSWSNAEAIRLLPTRSRALGAEATATVVHAASGEAAGTGVSPFAAGSAVGRGERR